MSFSISEREITCPYCEKKITNDSWEFPDSGEEECENCGKKFTYSRNVTVDYDCEPNCELNSEFHDYEFRNGAYFCNKCGNCALTLPKEVSK
jgi:transcription initiation factor TFIIIB Brf1 subunit/transcription initiation factor TFIIB